MNIVPITDKKYIELPETEVVRKVLSGEKGFYEILLRRNNQKLYRVLRGYLENHSDIEDIMQETYITAYEKLWQYRQDSTFSTWLIRIGINKALFKIKQDKRTTSLTSKEGLSIEIKDKNQGPENSLIQAEARHMLEVAIGRLDKKYRSAYIMKEVEEMSMAEISDCLGISVSNVKVRIHRAKAMIKEGLYDQAQSTDLYEFGFKKCDLLVERVMSRIDSY